MNSKIIITSALLSGSIFAQNIEIPQDALINSTTLGFTTAGLTGLNGTFDLSSSLVDTAGNALVAGSVVATYSNVATNASSPALATGGAINNNSFWDIVFNINLVQNDGSTIVDGNLRFNHGDNLLNNTTDGFNEADGNLFTFSGTSTATATNPSAGVYQITNDNGSASNSGSIRWDTTNITSANINPFTSNNIVNANYSIVVTNLTFDPAPAPVPEPSSTALLSLGALGLIARRKRA